MLFFALPKILLATEEPENIILLADKNSKVHKNITDAFKKNIEIKSIDIMSIQEFISSRDRLEKDTRLIISIGTNITAQLIELKISAPIFSIAIPKLSYQKLEKKYKESQSAGKKYPFSAIYIDQPLSRNLNLIQEILPSTKRINIALGPDTFHYSDSINNETKKRGWTTNIAKIDKEITLIKELNQTLIKSDVMLGIIDPLVFSRTSARNILLTTYRWRVPLIGISPAYVDAGALAAIHSSPNQLGAQLAEAIESLSLSHSTLLPPPQYPKKFKVSINYRVAEAMGIQIIEENELIKKLERLEKKQGFKEAQ